MSHYSIDISYDTLIIGLIDKDIEGAETWVTVSIILRCLLLIWIFVFIKLFAEHLWKFWEDF